jgi:hypothetical protein
VRIAARSVWLSANCASALREGQLPVSTTGKVVLKVIYGKSHYPSPSALLPSGRRKRHPVTLTTGWSVDWTSAITF